MWFTKILQSQPSIWMTIKHSVKKTLIFQRVLSPLPTFWARFQKCLVKPKKNINKNRLFFFHVFCWTCFRVHPTISTNYACFFLCVLLALFPTKRAKYKNMNFFLQCSRFNLSFFYFLLFCISFLLFGFFGFLYSLLLLCFIFTMGCVIEWRYENEQKKSVQRNNLISLFVGVCCWDFCICVFCFFKNHFL